MDEYKVTCPLCNHDISNLILILDDSSVYQCPICGIFFKVTNTDDEMKYDVVLPIEFEELKSNKNIGGC